MGHEGQKVLVVGIGNELLGDEGLGVHVARSLLAELAPMGSGRASLPLHVDVLVAGTSLLNIVPEMPRYARVIIVDAIQNNQRPGTLYRVDTLAELAGELEASVPLSLHEWNLIETLRAAEMLGLLPGKITLIGAEPESLAPSTELSPSLARAAKQIASILLEELGASRTTFTSTG